MTARKLTIRDVARTAGVSMGSVSRVLNGSSHVSPEMRRRVDRAVADLGFVPSLFAQGMRGVKTHMVGIVLRDIISPLLATFVRAAQAELSISGDFVLVVCHDERPERETHLLQTLARRHVDGLIIATSSEDDPDLMGVRRSLRIPVVYYDREISDGCDSVRVAHKQSSRRALDYLLHLGHRRIALVTGPTSVYTSRERVSAYSEAMQEQGIPLDPRLVRTRSFGPLATSAEVSALLDMPERPTALLLGGIDMLPETLHAIRDRSLAVPTDISLIGAGDTDVARLGVPPVTVLAWNFDDVGRATARLLKERVAGLADASPRTAVLPADLLIRASCGPPPISSKRSHST